MTRRQVASVITTYAAAAIISASTSATATAAAAATTTTTTTTTTTENNYKLMLEFLERFPEYSSNEFYITAESYGGHYMPTLAKYIVDHNEDGKINFGNYPRFRQAIASG